MADFEDATSPTWQNLIEGHLNLQDAIDRTISYATSEGKRYALQPEIAMLMVRPRVWHLNEKHVLLDGILVSASLFDAGLFFFHNAHKQRLLKRMLDEGDSDKISNILFISTSICKYKVFHRTKTEDYIF